MKTLPRTLLISLGLIGWVAADLPRKAPLTKYSRLWSDSPFTSKPPPPPPGEEVNPLEDYALCGVSPIPSGYRVTLLNKKNPEERIVVDSDRPKEGFSILSVSRKAGDPLGTVVRMSSGSVTGTVAFDEAHLAPVAPAAPAAPPKGPPGLQLPGQPGQPLQPGQIPQRQPRPRVVPPPTTQAQGGVPGAAPGAAAIPQPQPTGARPTGFTRPGSDRSNSDRSRFERSDRRR
jgi:hypothetical protein